MADDIKLSKAEIEELRSLIRLLKEDMSEAEFQNLLKTGPAAKKMLQDLRKESIEFTSDVGGVIQAFNQLMNEIKGTNSGINKVHSAFKGINKLAEEIQYAQRGSISLNEKDLAKLQEKMAMKKIDLENANKLLEIEKNEYEKTRKFNKDQIDFYQKEKEKLDNKTIWTEKDLKRSDDLEKLQKKAEERLKETEAKLGNIEKQQSNIAGILSDQDGHYNTLTATLAKLKRQLEDQNKLLGLGGAIIGSLDAALGQLGLGRLAGALGISEASAEMDEFAKQIVKDREEQLILEKEITDEVEARAKGQGKLSPEVLAEKQNQLEALKGQNAQYDGINGKLAVLKKGISSMGASLLKNLTDPVALTVGLVTQLFSALKTSDEATGKLARQFGTSYKEASNLRQELNSMANSSFDLNVTTQGLQESLMAVNQALGTNGKLNEADLVTMTKLTKQAGYTHDELMGIEKLSLSQGKSLDDNVKLTLGSAKAHAAMRGLMVNEREVLREVNKMSASLKLSLGGNVDKMAEAVVKTKEFGLSIEQAEKMADGLLQFESSISSELEAEMLTGKALNFEKARLLALNNDVAGAAAEIAKQVGTSADFTKMNRIQQEALAKAAGMTRDELAQSLMDREALVALSGVEGKTAKERFDNLVKEVGMEEAKKRLGNDELAKQYESQSVQEKFQATTQKVMDIFVSMAQPILDIVNALTPVFKFIGWIASGIGTIVNLLNKWTFGTLPLLIGGFFTLKLLSGGIGSALLKGLVYPFKAAKEGLSSLGGGLKSMFSEIKEKGVGKAFKDAFTSIKDKIKSKTSDKGKSKVEDLADKAKDKGDKASDSAKGGDNAKGFAERMKNIAKGIKAFADKDVFLGALNLIPVSIGLIAMLPGFLGAKAIESIDGKKIKSSLEGLAKGIEAFGSGKITGGAANLIVASVGLTSMLLGVLGAKAIETLNGKKIKSSLEGLAEGIEAFGKGKITGGAANLIAASIGLTAMLPGVLGALAIQSIDGKKIQESLQGLANGIEAFGKGKVTGGSFNLIAASIGLTTMVVGALGALAIQSIDGKKIKSSLEGLAGGLEAMANGKVTGGALNLVVASIGLTTMVVGALGAKLIETIDGEKIQKSLYGLAYGLEAMAKGKVLLGSLALIAAGVGLVAATPGMIAAAVLGTVGTLIEKGLKSFASGIERLATGKVFLGALALGLLGAALIPAAYALKMFGDVNWSDLGKAGLTLVGLGVAGAVLGSLAGQMILGAIAIAALGASLIPAAYALKMFSDISWEDLGKAGVALVGLGVAGAVLGSLLPLMLMGAIAIAALGASLFPLALALNLAAPALDQFSEALSKIDGSALFSAAAGIGALGIAMAAFGGGSLISGIGSAIGEFFGGDPVEKFNKLASIDGEKLKVTADSINTLGTAINNLDANKLGEVGDGFEKLSDSLSKSLLSSSIGDLLGAESPVSSMIAQLNELGSFDSTKILTIAEAITKLSESITNLNSITANVGDVSPIITTVDKVVELHDSLNKTSLEKVVDKVSEGVSSLFSKAFEFVSSVSSTDKTATNTESTASTSSLSTAASSKSLVDKTNIEAKEVILNISSKATTNLTSDKSKEINAKLTSSDKVKELENTKKLVGEFDTNKLKEELLTSEKTNELVSTGIDNLKVTNLITEKQSSEKTKESTLDKASGIIGGAMTGAEIGGLFGPLGMLAGGLIGGAASLFEGSEEEITPINNEIQPLNQTVSSPNSNISSTSTSINNQNIASNDNVVRVLQEAVTILKAIQAKDTTVQLAVDGDIIAKKITPNVSREQVRTYSSIS